MKLGKDTLRKRLNRANYRYNKDLKQYELDINTCTTHNPNTKVTQSVITQKNTDITLKKVEFTEEEIITLKDIVIALIIFMRD